MNSRIMILMLTALLCAPAGSVEIEGVKLADTATVAGRDLVLNGAGLRKRLLFDVYVASLYLPAKVSAAAAVLKAEPRRVEIQMLRKVGADDFLEALKNGIEANASRTERHELSPPRWERISREGERRQTRWACPPRAMAGYHDWPRCTIRTRRQDEPRRNGRMEVGQ